MLSRLARRLVAAGCGCTALVAACSTMQTVGSLVPAGTAALQLATGRPQLSDADEERMAQENARAFEDSVPMWDDPLLDAYLTEITQRLVAVARPRPFTYRIRVVKDPAVNAFTFGGGLLYVNAGLIARMENEAQLAMVLGHEIAHVTQRHIPRGIESAFGIQLAGQLAATAAAESGVLPGSALEQTYKYTMNAAMNGHGRARETEADEVGMEYLVKAGYDPREAPKTFEQLLKEYGDQARLVNFFYGSHPTNVSRIEHTRQLATGKYGAATASGRLTANTEEFQRRTREIVVATGVLDYEAKRFNTAKAMFEKAVPVSESDPIPHYYLGKIALETGGGAGVDRAIAHLRDANRADAGFAPAHRELGLAYYRKKDKRSAIAALEQYLKLAPGAEDTARIRTMIRELKRS
jgi:predicted Zn-dependent protease